MLDDRDSVPVPILVSFLVASFLAVSLFRVASWCRNAPGSQPERNGPGVPADAPTSCRVLAKPLQFLDYGLRPLRYYVKSITPVSFSFVSRLSSQFKPERAEPEVMRAMHHTKLTLSSHFLATQPIVCLVFGYIPFTWSATMFFRLITELMTCFLRDALMRSMVTPSLYYGSCLPD